VGKEIDECPIATAVAQQLDVRHQCIRLAGGELDHELDQFFASMDQPTVDGINTWLVSRAAVSAGLKVALSGLGATSFWRVRQFSSSACDHERAHRPGGMSRPYIGIHSHLGAYSNGRRDAGYRNTVIPQKVPTN
jgi:asparagine synthase (glutamine-hydrolysing)